MKSISVSSFTKARPLSRWTIPLTEQYYSEPSDCKALCWLRMVGEDGWEGTENGWLARSREWLAEDGWLEAENGWLEMVG
jgi:hypothetical protein